MNNILIDDINFEKKFQRNILKLLSLYERYNIPFSVSLIKFTNNFLEKAAIYSIL